MNQYMISAEKYEVNTKKRQWQQNKDVECGSSRKWDW